MDECFGNGLINFQWITLTQLREMIIMDDFDVVEWTSTHVLLVKDVHWMELKSIDKCCQQWILTWSQKENFEWLFWKLLLSMLKVALIHHMLWFVHCWICMNFQKNVQTCILFWIWL
jgi:hypothetical protein